MANAKVVVLDKHNESIQYLITKDKRLAKVISLVGNITYCPHEDPYPFLVHEIIEQMLSTKASAKIYERLTQLCQGNVSPDVISKLSDDEIKSIGTSSLKVKCIKNLTDAIISGDIIFDKVEMLSDEDVIKTLTQVKGIGNWTAKMYLIFVLDRKDVLPYEDVAFLQGYGWMYKTNDFSPSSVKKKCKKWKPYSSIAARYMYRALDMGFTKKEFHLFKEI